MHDSINIISNISLIICLMVPVILPLLLVVFSYKWYKKLLQRGIIAIILLIPIYGGHFYIYSQMNGISRFDITDLTFLLAYFLMNCIIAIPVKSRSAYILTLSIWGCLNGVFYYESWKIISFSNGCTSGDLNRKVLFVMLLWFVLSIVYTFKRYNKLKEFFESKVVA